MSRMNRLGFEVACQETGDGSLRSMGAREPVVGVKAGTIFRQNPVTRRNSMSQQIEQTAEHSECPYLTGFTYEQADAVLAAVLESGANDGWSSPLFLHHTDQGWFVATHMAPPFAIRRAIHLAIHKAVVVLKIEEPTDCPSYDH